jgi:hypothetical protein
MPYSNCATNGSAKRHVTNPLLFPFLVSLSFCTLRWCWPVSMTRPRNHLIQLYCFWQQSAINGLSARTSRKLSHLYIRRAPRRPSPASPSHTRKREHTSSQVASLHAAISVLHSEQLLAIFLAASFEVEKQTDVRKQTYTWRKHAISSISKFTFPSQDRLCIKVWQGGTIFLGWAKT